MSERPLECSECHKPVKVVYTEIVGKSLTRQVMCASCPVLQRKLRGSLGADAQAAGAMGGTSAAGICCGTCGTTLESVRSGHPVGCVECYEIFGDILVAELISTQSLPPSIAVLPKGTPLHVGRGPGQVSPVSPSVKLIALNEALSDVLKREDYEQAARLRDQIKALKKEGGNGGQQEGGKPTSQS